MNKDAYENDSELRDIMNKSLHDPNEHEDQAQEIVPARKKKKEVLYSDKEESSIDENMHDTPSNYNVPNGRLDGKSLGLNAHIKMMKKQEELERQRLNNTDLTKSDLKGA